MADTKITALTAITTVDPAVDVLPIVDVSDTTMAASGTTKKITSNQILGAGGTATLASATITGDLTVDTSTLKVDSTNNRVGIGTASPTHALDVTSSATTVIRSLASASNQAYVSVAGNGGVVGTSSFDLIQDGSSNAFVYNRANTYLAFGTNNSERYRIASDGVATWSNVGGVAGTAMTLNSTGLGVGATPIAKLHVKVTGGSDDTLLSYGANQDNFYTAGSSGVHIFRNLGTERMRIDTSGNVGIGGNASATGIDTGVARLFVVAPNSNTGMAATFIADSVGRGLLVADQGKTNSFGVEVVAGLVKTGGFTSGTSVALFANAVERARVKSTGQVRFVPLAADPSGAEAGDVYYNSSSNKLKCYNGSTWNDLF